MSTSEPSGSRPSIAYPDLETLIVPSSERNKSSHTELHGKKAVLIALLANILIGASKLLAGLLGRQSALLAEAMHSFADSLNSLFLLIGLQKGSRAADKTHPFGYGLETTLWAMLASVMMLALAVWSVYIGVKRIMQPEPMEGYLLSASVLVFSIGMEILAVGVASAAVLNEKDIVERRWLPRLILAAQHVKTIVSPTTRFVFYEDTVALGGAIIALIAITISEFGVEWSLLPAELAHIPDASASILIGLMLLGLAVYLFLHNSKGLTGSAASPQFEEKIRNFVLNLSGVSQVHDLRTIDYGLSGIVVHMRVEVDPDTQVKDVDDLTERIRDRIQARMGNIKEVIIEVLADETNIEWSDQFYELIAQGRERGVLKPREEEILKNVYEFTNVVVSDIMVPRTDVDCIEVSATLSELVEMIIETGHTRILVYREDVDDMLGVIHAKDVFSDLRGGNSTVSLEKFVRPMAVYPENKPVSDLLEEFKRKKIQIAMVADEHGGFAGMVTIEDLLEEIVGEIWDEYDQDTNEIEVVSPTQIRLNGRCDIDELNERFMLNIPDEEFNTVAGFVFGLLGREPEAGDTIAFEDLTFTVLDMEGHRIERIQLDSPVPFETEQDEESSSKA